MLMSNLAFVKTLAEKSGRQVNRCPINVFCLKISPDTREEQLVFW